MSRPISYNETGRYVVRTRYRKIHTRGNGPRDFDNLPGKGKPLDLTSYFDTLEELRMAYSMLKSGQFIPEEVELLNEIAEVKRRISAETIEAKKATLVRKLNDSSLRLSLILERYRRK